MEKPESITTNDWKLLKAKYKNLNKVVKKLNKNYPVQYLIGNVNFYGYNINVNKHVLIPRFETETLVEKTIEYIKQMKLENSSLIDLGTGSGCMSIVLKKELETLNITGLDISNKALKIARKNAKNNKADINFIKENIFKFKPVTNYLNKKNLIAFEIGDEQGKDLKKLAKDFFPKAKIKLESDLSGRDRYLFIINE